MSFIYLKERSGCACTSFLLAPEVLCTSSYLFHYPNHVTPLVWCKHQIALIVLPYLFNSAMATITHLQVVGFFYPAHQEVARQSSSFK